ncbi:MAG: endoribonuclease [Cryobacterium sp.]|jgi:enamine deaminase RidA (YjgF/YER057c/UK114 family)|nr:endoribonuclease [Cryobacterium sp.]
MSTPDTRDAALPLARYAPFRRAGDLVYFAGIIAVDPASGKVIGSYSDLPEEMREAAGQTGEISVDSKDGPIAAQSWYIMESLRRTLGAAGGTLNDIVNLTQYFTDLRDFPVYNRIRGEFFEIPPASTCVRVVELLPTDVARLEVQAVAYIPVDNA